MEMIYAISAVSILVNLLVFGAANEMLGHAKKLYQKSMETEKKASNETRRTNASII